MPRTEIRYTYIAKGRYWRFRHALVGDVALPGTPGDPAFHAKYAELTGLLTAQKKIAAPARNSWRWLTKQYRASAEFRALADVTQRDYGRTLDILDTQLGNEPFALTTTGMIRDVRDDFAGQQRKAHKVKQIASLLYSWADDRQLVPPGFNPAKDLRRLKKTNKREYVCWSDHEFTTFTAGAIAPMVTAAMLARYTGQRAQDLVTMVWSDYQGDTIRVRQSKTGTPLIIACPTPLRTYLDGLKRERGAIVILTNAAGTAYNANSLSSAMGREVGRVEGMPANRSIHGLRYMAGADLEEAGCTVGQIQAVLGHHAYQMAMKYATQRLRSREAAVKRDRNEA